jgi:hypothetical protein
MEAIVLAILGVLAAAFVYFIAGPSDDDDMAV